MTEQEIQDFMECRSESHDQHLCYLISQGFHLSDEQEFRLLTENPKFQCRRCGRIANKDKNLCVPFEL